MPDAKYQPLSGVSETLLIALYIRAMESQRPDALIRDEKAVELVACMNYDFGQIRRMPLSGANKLVRNLLTRELDRYTRDFLARQSQAVVVHIGCGLDSRFERVDNGQVEWFDLDLPPVIELRQKLFGDEGQRHHLLAYSALDSDWLAALSAYRQLPCLFLAEVVFVYFDEAQVKSLVLMLRDHFPGAELVFDAWSPFHIWWSRLQLSVTRFGALFHWGVWRGQDIERWGDGIRLLDEWGWLDQPEPRLAGLRRLRSVEALARTMRVYHFQLGG